MGNVVELLDDNSGGEGWTTCLFENKTGYIPTAYLQVIKEKNVETKIKQEVRYGFLSCFF